jgi:hypothetical protein
MGFGDIAFGPGDELLVSDRFWNLFQKAKLSGLIEVGMVEVFRLRTHKKLRNAVPTYLCCRVSRSKGVVDDYASSLVREEGMKCGECRQGGIIKRSERVVLESDTWSGEDVFFARGLPGIILTSIRFKQFCDTNGFDNCIFIPASSFSFNHYPWERVP